MSFNVRLTRAGIRHEYHQADEAEVRIHRPATVPELLRFWHHRLDAIDNDYTLGDLLALLRGVADTGCLSQLFSCDVAEFLSEASQPCDSPAADIEFLRVYNTADLSGYEEGPRGSRVSGGRFVPPYAISRGFDGWGAWSEPYPGAWEKEPTTPRQGAIAVEFTPVNQLVHLPLRYDAKVGFEADVAGPAAFETEITIEFGEFVHAVIWEIGFFGSPVDRNEKRNELDARASEMDEAIRLGDRSRCRPFDIDKLLKALDEQADEDAPGGEGG
jgi:hypothetical protein